MHAYQILVYQNKEINNEREVPSMLKHIFTSTLGIWKAGKRTPELPVQLRINIQGKSRLYRGHSLLSSLSTQAARSIS